MEDPALRPAGDLPPEYSEVPIESAVSPTSPETALATAPDGNPLLQSDANVIAQTVEFPPDPGVSADIQLDLKDPEVRDIGWNRDLAHLPPTIVHGLSNDDLFTLIRRFDKQIYHVKAIPPPPLGQLDLEISENEEFSPDKLRAHLERFYMIIVTGIAAFGKHIARIRSWNEPRRTAGFTIAYYLAWFSNLLGALISMALLTLILHPPSRRYLFPPAPFAAVSAKSGNLQVPRAGTIGSGDSLSGAPEAHKGEAVEQEATNFVSGVASLAIGTATGQKVPPHAGQSEDVDAAKQEEGGIGASMPEPTQLAAQTADATHVAQGARADGKHDATKTHVEAAMWETARPAMRALSDVVDTWERFGNALSPTPPFSHMPRLRLAAVVLSLMVAMTIVPSALFVKATTFGIGFGMFGQPIMTRSVHWITTRYPNWREALELRRTLLKGVPTNAQLTVTLLRIAEAHKTPLPPPPSTNKVTEGEEPNDPEAAVKERDYDFDTSNYEVESAHADENVEQGGEDETNANAGEPKLKSGNKLTKLLKGTGKATVSGALGIDHIKAKMGSEAAKRRLGAVPDDDKVITSDGPTGSRVGVGDGPTTYAARMHGKRGYVVLVTSAASPFLSFVWEKDLKRNLASIAKTVAAAAGKAEPEPEAPPGVFTIALKEVGGLRKVGGYGWKGKMVIGWALQREVVDGLEIEDEAGEKRVLTAIKGRDELFNRLIAVGGHSWECY